MFSCLLSAVDGGTRASEQMTFLVTRTPARTADRTNSHAKTIGGSLLRLAVKLCNMWVNLGPSRSQNVIARHHGINQWRGQHRYVALQSNLVIRDGRT